MAQALHKSKSGSRSRKSEGATLFLAHTSGDTVVRKSAAAEIFRQVAAGSPIPMGKLRALVIPDASWKRSKETLSPTASQATARVAHILAIAESVWGNTQDAVEWLNAPHAELNGTAPYTLLRTESGGRTVESLLMALDNTFPA